MKSSTPNHLRPLGWGEQLWWRLSEAGSANGTMLASLEGPVDADRLRKAIRQAMFDIPILRAVARSAPQPHFELLPHFEVPLVVLPRDGADHWRRFTETELLPTRRIGHDAQPLWRMTLLQGASTSDLLFTFNHTIGDGLSGTLVFDAVLRCYSGTQPMGGRNTLPRAYDELLGPMSGGQRLRAGLQWLASLLLKHPVCPLPGLTHPANPAATAHLGTVSGSYTRVIDTSIDAITTARLLKVCKARGSSMNDLISGALLLAGRHAIDAAGPVRMSLSSAINVRGLLTQAMDTEVGYYVTGVEGDYSVSPDTDPFALGQQVGQHTRAQLTREKVWVNLMLRRMVLAFKRSGKSLLATAPKAARSSLHLTNLGRVNLPTQYGDLRLRRCFHIAAVDLVQSPYVCLACATFDGTLQLTFSYCAPQTSELLAENLAARVKALLIKTASPDTQRMHSQPTPASDRRVA